MQARKYHSKVLQRLQDKMARDPWYVKLQRWFKLQIWTYTALTRRYWDKTYKHYIFRK